MIATKMLGDYLSACKPESSADLYKPLSLMMSLVAKACAGVVGKEVAINWLAKVAEQVLESEGVVRVTASNEESPTKH